MPLWSVKEDTSWAMRRIAPESLGSASGLTLTWLLALGLERSSSEVITAAIRQALVVAAAGESADAALLEEVLDEARALAAASRVIPAGSPVHAYPDYEILEASVLWHLDRKDEALAILRRHGWPGRRRLPELDAETFPGLVEDD